jgi:peptidoglycan-N-acetylglucosamine deacetylase
MYPVRTPGVIRALAPYATWSLPNDTRSVYLTFDDGPTPGVTPEVLDILMEHDARATFFCLGKNVERYPEIVRRIRQEGHHIGHHSYSHSDGWKTNNFTYLREVLKGAGQSGTALFRPPYGRITPWQAQAVCKRFRLVMWDIVSGDFDVHQTPGSCTENVLKHAEPGSIIVFHDSIKAAPRVLQSLPAVLAEFRKRGYRMDPIPYP